MKKNLLSIASAIVFLLAFNSCADKLDLDKTLSFSKLTVEEQKQSIEQNGLDFMAKMDGLNDTKAMAALNAFVVNTGMSPAGAPAFVKPISQLRTNIMRNDVKALDKFNGQMKVMAAEDNDIWGTYTWNSTIEDFDYSPSTNTTITVLFPATEGSTSNTGELKLTYVESDVQAPDTDPAQYMPKSIDMVIKVSGSVVLEATYSGSYNSDATPKKVTQTLKIDKYNWKFEFANDAEDASVKYSVKYGTEVLMQIEAAAAGTLTATAIENSLGSKDGGPQDIFNSGAVYFQVMNIAMVGGFKDFQAFYEEGSALDEEDENYYQNEADVWNKYLVMYAYFVKEKKKFADVEFYVNTYSDDYDTYTEVAPRLVLSDGSKQTIEEFFTTGFEDLIAEIQSYQTEYGK